MKTKKSKAIGVLIKEYRIKAGLTQMDLANELGYKIPQFISLIENGHSKLPLNIAAQIIHRLQIPEKLVLDSLVNAYRLEAMDHIHKGKKAK